MKTWKYHASILVFSAVICFAVCYFQSVLAILMFAVYGLLAALDDVRELVGLKFRLNKLEKQIKELNRFNHDPD